MSHELPAPLRGPYLGLDSFGAGDAPLFFGRDRYAQQLKDAIELKAPLVAVIGPPGSGKTSLINAGFVGRTQREPRAGRTAVFSVEHPGHQPLHQLMAQGLAHPGNGFAESVSAWLRAHRAVQHVLFLVDHAEELGAGVSSTSRRHFVEQLEALIGSMPTVTVLIAVRDDCLPQLAAAAPRLVERLLAAALYLPPVLDFADWTAMVRSRAEARGVSLEPRLLDELAQDLEELNKQIRNGERAGSVLPHLEFALTLAWARHSGKQLTALDYRATGGVLRAITRWVSAQWASLSATEQEWARLLMVELIHVGSDGTPAISRPCGLPQEPNTAVPGEPSQRARWQFLASRGLVRINSELQAVELPHSVLLNCWPDLARWQQEERRFAEWHSTASSLAFRFSVDTQGAAGDLSEVLAADDLAEAELWCKQRPQQISEPVLRLVETKRLQRLSQRTPSTIAVARDGAALLPSTTPALIAAPRPEVGTTAPSPPVTPAVQLSRSLAAGPVLWGALSALIIALLFLLRWHLSEQAVLQRELLSEKASRAALLVHQPGLDGEALRMVIDAVSPSIESGSLDPPPLVREGLMVVLSVARNSLALYGHEDRILQVAYSPNGRRLATVGDDRTLRIWDSSTGRALQVLRGHQDSIFSVAFSADGKSVLTASNDKTARLWDVERGLLKRTLGEHASALRFAIFSPDDRQILTGCADGSATLWDSSTGALAAQLSGHSGPLVAGAFSHDGKLVGTTSQDRTARLWESKTGKLRAELRGHLDGVNGIQFFQGDERVVTGSRDQSIRIWSLDGAQLAIRQRHEASVWQLRFSADGRFLASSDANGVVHLWDGPTAEHHASLVGHVDSVDAISFTPDSSHLISAGYDRTVRIWNLRTQRPLAVLRGHPGKLYSLDVSSDGRHVATVGYDRTVRIWDMRPSMPTLVLEGHQGRVHHVAWGGPGGGRIVTAGYDGKARIWEWPTGKLIAELRGHTKQIYRVAIADDGTRVATASADGTVRLWDARAGESIQILDGHHGEVYSIAFTKDSRLLLSSGEDGTVRTWDARSGASMREALVVSQHSVEWLALDSSGTRMVTADMTGEVVIWDVGTMSRRASLLDYRSPVNTAAFVNRGPQLQLISASEDRTVRVWSAETGQQIKLLHSLPDWVVSAMPSANGNRLVVVGKDRAIRLWDLKTEAPVVELPILADDLYFATYAPDGSHFAVVGSDGTTKIYRDDYTSDLRGMRQLACQQLRSRPEYERVRDECRLASQ